MSRRPDATQLGFDALLANADRDNTTRQMDRDCAHLPGTMEEAIPYLRSLIERHHAAMLTADLDAVMALREEADRLATKLNNYEPGILAGPDAPGNVLERATAAPDRTVPLWGQSGTFEIAVGTMRVRIEMDGVFGIAASCMAWLGFAARAVEFDRPFISETGYQSFIAPGGVLEPGYTPDRFAAELIAAHIRHDLKGKLVAIEPRYRRGGGSSQ